MATKENSEPMRKLIAHCNSFKGADTGRSIFQLATTACAYFATCAVMLYSFVHGYYLAAIPLIILASGLLVRLFIIQHDCGHGSFFRSRRANDMVGRCISVLTFTPYDFWRRAHSMHHAASGNLSGRGVGSLDTLTVKEYLALPPRERRIYRMYRNPVTQAVFIPILYIFFIQRFPPSQSLPFLKNYKSISFAKSWRSIFALDAALAVGIVLMGIFVGWAPLFLGYIPVVVLTTLMGGWLFFIQHQFEGTYWNHQDGWNFHEAAVFGSSYYILPPVLKWFSGNIGIHHIHHLCSKIPNYKLQACLNGNAMLQQTNRMTLKESFKCLRYALWDEVQKKMVSFRELQIA